jgi:translation initiation factor IF-2
MRSPNATARAGGGAPRVDGGSTDASRSASPNAETDPMGANAPSSPSATSSFPRSSPFESISTIWPSPNGPKVFPDRRRTRYARGDGGAAGDPRGGGARDTAAVAPSPSPNSISRSSPPAAARSGTGSGSGDGGAGAPNGPSSAANGLGSAEAKSNRASSTGVGSASSGAAGPGSISPNPSGSA